jgi:GT2 family glycosyltransferase
MLTAFSAPPTYTLSAIENATEGSAYSELISSGRDLKIMMVNAVSVIIPTRGYSDNLRAAVLSLTRTAVSEIIVVSKAAINVSSLCSDGRVKLLFAPEAGLSEARNLGVSKSSSDIVAFTDDDCTVPQDWPLLALEVFADSNVGVVGGPGVTDPADSWRSKCSGAVLSTRLGTSTSVYRYTAISDRPKAAGEKQLSTCNLFFRRSVLDELSYFHPVLETCEENELIERIRSAGYMVLYSPACVVFHHRRPLFRPFLRQISKYAKGRAVFILEFPKFLRPVCIVPSILVLLTLMLLILSIFSLRFAGVLAVILTIYSLMIAIAAVISTPKNRLKLRFAPLVFLGIVTMHYCYGLSFLIGLCNAVKTRGLCELASTLQEPSGE